MQDLPPLRPTSRRGVPCNRPQVSVTISPRRTGPVGRTGVTTSLSRVGKSIRERTEQYFLNLAGKQPDLPTKSARGLLYHVPDLPTDRNRDSVVRELDRTVEGLKGAGHHSKSGHKVHTSGEYKIRGPGSHFKHHYQPATSVQILSGSEKHRSRSQSKRTANTVTASISKPRLTTEKIPAEPDKVAHTSRYEQRLDTWRKREAGPKASSHMQSPTHGEFDPIGPSKPARHGYTKDGEPRVLQVGPSVRKPQLKVITDSELFDKRRLWKSYSPTTVTNSTYQAFKPRKLDHSEKEVVICDLPEVQEKKYRIATMCLSSGESLSDELKAVMSAISPILEDETTLQTPTRLVSPLAELPPNTFPPVELPYTTPITPVLNDSYIGLEAHTQVLHTARAKTIQIHTLARSLPLGQRANAPDSKSVHPQGTTTAPTRTRSDFNWPRYIDTEYEDPAVEWSRQCREKKRLRVKAEKERQMAEPLIDLS